MFPNWLNAGASFNQRYFPFKQEKVFIFAYSEDKKAWLFLPNSTNFLYFKMEKMNNKNPNSQQTLFAGTWRVASCSILGYDRTDHTP